MDLLVRPVAESSFFVLGDIGALDRAKGYREGTRACVRGAFRFRVASATAGDGKDVLTLGNEIFAGLSINNNGNTHERCKSGQPKHGLYYSIMSTHGLSAMPPRGFCYLRILTRSKKPY